MCLGQLIRISTNLVGSIPPCTGVILEPKLHEMYFQQNLSIQLYSLHSIIVVPYETQFENCT